MEADVVVCSAPLVLFSVWLRPFHQ